LTQKTCPPIKHTSGDRDASVTEGQHQEDIDRWGSQMEGLNPERKQAGPVGRLDEWRGDLSPTIARSTAQRTRKRACTFVLFLYSAHRC